MEIEICNIIKQEFEKTGWSATQFAQQLKRDRTIVYHIFKRKVFDTDLLYDISMALNIDLFKLYSEVLEQNNEVIRLKNQKDSCSIIEKKRKVMIEVELNEDEYRMIVSKI